MEARHFRRPHWPKFRMWIRHTSFIFQTGVGTRALFAVIDSLGLTDVLLRPSAGSRKGPQAGHTKRTAEPLDD
jgi:hypothetical protein